MKLIVGLGNPGPKYEKNRHNVGFMVVERLAERCAAGPFREKFKGLFTKVSVGARDAVLLEPMTYMNLSGESAQPAARFFKVAVGDVIVVHDELDLPFGTLRVKMGGGTAGHNGLKSLVKHLGAPSFVRLRVGIGRPRSGDPIRHVLGDFDASERAELDDVLDAASDALERIVRDGPEDAMQQVNRRKER